MTLRATECLALARSAKEGLHIDEKGLYLRVDPVRASWVFRYTFAGKRRVMGLGGFPLVSLADARVAASAARSAVASGIDPQAQKREAKERAIEQADAAETASHKETITFAKAAGAFVAGHRAGWRNKRHADQVVASLEAYALPAIGSKPVANVDTDDVLAILQPIWSVKPETASRVRQRIEAVMAYSAAHGWRERGLNPAIWKGHLDAILPSPAKLRRVRHHPALAWRRVPAFMARLHLMSGLAPLALRFTVMTAARSGEVRGMTWREIDLELCTWTVPPERIKAGREHRVPLSAAAVAILQDRLRVATDEREGRRPDRSDIVWPGAAGTLSDMTLAAVIKRMNKSDTAGDADAPFWSDVLGVPAVPHGFRSSFRDWAADNSYSTDIAEAALAHVVGDATTRAYQRGDLLERRRAMMEAWAVFIVGDREK